MAVNQTVQRRHPHIHLPRPTKYRIFVPENWQTGIILLKLSYKWLWRDLYEKIFYNYCCTYTYNAYCFS